jgi:hypothetical protein
MSLDTSIWDGFDAAELAAAQAAYEGSVQLLGQSAAIQQQHRAFMRRATSHAVLGALLPATIAPGDSWHVLSTGDVDVLSYTTHLLNGLGFVHRLLMATWRINRDDLEQIDRWIDAGIVERFDLLIDLRFSRLSPDEYALAKAIAGSSGGHVTTVLNHSKVTLLAAPSAHLVIESSANINQNHRIEQTAIHHNADLFAFYLDYYDAVGRRTRAR